MEDRASGPEEFDEGRYQLRIDKNPVGTYSHIDLARGIELQENVNTPQYQQAWKVAQLSQ